MATPSKRGKYLFEANDLVDDFIFNVVIKHVNTDQIRNFARHFGLEFDFLPTTDQLTTEAQVS